MTAPAPAPFEELRLYVLTAVDQLLEEMAEQQVRYLVPAENALALVEGVAAVQGRSPWEVWEDWALRHALPVHQLVQGTKCTGLSTTEHTIMRARLRDLLGYTLLGLLLSEKLDNIDKS